MPSQKNQGVPINAGLQGGTTPSTVDGNRQNQILQSFFQGTGGSQNIHQNLSKLLMSAEGTLHQNQNPTSQSQLFIDEKASSTPQQEQ
jgi:hypothetical protein